MDLSLGMKYTNMIIVAILALRFLIKLRFPANTPISLFKDLNPMPITIYAVTGKISDFSQPETI